MITIWNFPRGARGTRVAWLCEEMGLPYRVSLLSYPVPAQYRARNPLGTVPFLEDGETAITESTAMILHLAAKHGPSLLLPRADSREHARVLQMTIFSEATLGTPINALIIDRFAVPQDKQGGHLQQLLLNRVEQGLDFLSQTLGDAPYLAGENFTVADIAVCTSLDIWHGALKGGLPKNLSDYHHRTVSRPAYGRAAEANKAS